MKNIKKETIKVTSTAIKKASYERSKKILTIKFHNGNIYYYPEIEPFIFEGLKESDSVGKFLNKYIIHGNN
jgi:hypothetical protein